MTSLPTLTRYTVGAFTKSWYLRSSPFATQRIADMFNKRAGVGPMLEQRPLQHNLTLKSMILSLAGFQTHLAAAYLIDGCPIKLSREMARFVRSSTTSFDGVFISLLAITPCMVQPHLQLLRTLIYLHHPGRLGWKWECPLDTALIRTGYRRWFKRILDGQPGLRMGYYGRIPKLSLHSG